MSQVAGTAYHFLPWVRFGLMNDLPVTDPREGTSSPQQIPSRAPISVKLRVNDVDSDAVSVPLRLYGPGDVIGIDPREIVRTDPPNLASNFPAQRLVTIEFDRPDFCWLFTPAAPNGDLLRPWIVLAVVKKRLSTITVNPARPLPMLECPAAELPDLAESSLWAHAQFVGSLSTETLATALSSRPNQTISRLICPRRLEPSTGGADDGYYACLVPAFEVGRKAGLDIELTDDDRDLQPAWSISAVHPVQLPVYYSWELSTGPDGDFETLVDSLTMRPEATGAKPHSMDLSQPGGGLRFPGAELGVPSILGPRDDARVPAAVESGLLGVLEPPPASAQPILPPIYGGWHAADGTSGGRPSLAPDPTRPWLRRLNLDPRYRVAAALGAQVVQQQQEQLVAAAWEQAGRIQDVNQWLRQKQLAREVTRSVYEKRLKPLAPAPFEQLTAPVVTTPPAGAPTAPPRGGTPVPPAAASAAAFSPSGRIATVPAAPGDMASASLSAALPLRDAVVSPSFRRIARPRGPLLRRPSPARPPSTPPGDGLTTLVQAVVDGRVDALQVAPLRATNRGDLLVRTAGLPVPLAVAAGPVRSAAPAPVEALGSRVQDLVAQLNPDLTFAAEASARVALPDEAADRPSRADPLQPVMVTPIFPQPMYEPLRDLFPGMFLPDLEAIPNNSVTVLNANQQVIEAFMVGLNDELSRELLWRELPTSLRGTYFRQFWDVRAQISSAMAQTARESLFDIAEVADWHADLGENAPVGHRTVNWLLLIKGDLLLRYPTAIISAAPGRWPAPTDGSEPVYPIVDESRTELPLFRVSPVPGVTLVGFSLTQGSVPATKEDLAGSVAQTGSPGWFFIFEEHPTEPSFGLDLSRDGSLVTWRELAWDDLATRSDRSGYIAVRTRTPQIVPPTGLPTNAPPAVRTQHAVDSRIAWGSHAGAQAYITLQKPYRQEVHGSYWFPDALRQS